MRNAVVFLLAGLVAGAAAQTIYHGTPDWISGDTQVSTGAALVDLDRDGWPDLVVSNGNDMAQQRLVAYYNRGDGTFPSLPDWQSGDAAFNGHLDVADVNGDGWPDVAVAVLGNGSPPPRAAKLYLNHGGTLSSTPDWSSSLQANTFTVAFGDVNNDGRPDLALATGWPYGTPNLYRNAVHVNVGGQLEQTPSWQSADRRDYMCAVWVDADRDGWQDLLFTGAGNETYLYRNVNGTLQTAAIWHTTDSASQFAVMATAGDVNGDGYRDLFVTDNTQLGGNGRFKQYNGLAAGTFSTTYGWNYYDGYGSAVALADVDGDGDLDLATGAWWDKTRLFLNTGTGLPSSPAWSSTPNSVVEKIVFADIDKNSLRTVVETFPMAPIPPHLFCLAHQPIQEIAAVRRNGVLLTPDQFTFSGERGWVTVGPAEGDVEVDYTVSTRLDMAVSNWDDNIGNYVYYNLLVLHGDANCDGRLDNFDITPFVMLLSDRPAYEAQWPDCDADTFCDMNGDGRVDNFDITGFVAALAGA